MQISTHDARAHELEADALVVVVPQDQPPPSSWAELDEALDGLLAASLAELGFKGKCDEALVVPTRGRGKAATLVASGLGKIEEADLEAWRRAVATGCKRARSAGARVVAVPIPALLDSSEAEMAAACAEAAILGTYKFQEYKAPPEDQAEIEALRIGSSDGAAAAAVEAARTIAEAACWARDLVNRPGNAKRTPALAEEASSMAKSRGLSCDILDAERCAELGMGALLAVGGGSDAPPRVVILEHMTEGAEDPPVVLVGKGITFDSGGISIKPSLNMGDMKADMAGAAAVLGTLRAVAEIGIERPVVGIAPLAENLPSATAYRPGDIVKAYSGTTIEVVNTDAEGRLILADALAYAAERFQPAAMVDLATLTGACVVALGSIAAGLLGNDEELCRQLQAAGDETGERVWHLPTWAAYDKIIDGDVADVKNSGGREAGVITAAKFLQRFVGDTRWAHLDIAGTAYLNKGTPYQPKGATGFGVRLLTQWLLS